jgi:hypothetical protein
VASFGIPKEWWMSTVVVALGHGHGREDRGGPVGADQEVDLVDGDETLVERPGDVGLRLVVEQHPFDGPTEQTVPPVHLLDGDLAGDLVQHRRRAEGAGQGQGAADAYGWTRRRGESGAGLGQSEE